MNIHDNKLPPVTTNPLQMIGIDIETFGQTLGRLHRPEGRLASLQISIGDDVYMIYNEGQVGEALRRVDVGIWCIQNAMFDLRQLRRWTTIEPRRIWDTFLVERDLWGGYYTGFSLQDMARRYLDMRIEKDIREEFANASEWTPEMKQYAALDPILNVKIAEEQKKIGVPNFYWDIDEPMLWVFLDFEPVKVDVEGWLQLVADFKERGASIEQEILGGLNVYSPPQVRAFLREEYNLKLESTGAAILEPLQDEYPLIEQILYARQLRKADSTYGAKWIDTHVESGDLVYTDYGVTGTITGRPISRNPNLANIPARKIPEFRNMFISKYEGGLLTVSDLSQQEPRILACESLDKELIRIFQEDGDIHAEVARAIYKDPSIVKGDPRRDTGKVLGLATNYDMSAETLARKIGVSEAEAQQFITNYFVRFRGVWVWRENQKRIARRNEYVLTRSGRKCWVNTYQDKYERNAINSPIQGGGADVLKLWLRTFWDKCRSKGLRFPVILQVYDEVVIDQQNQDEVDVYVPMLLESAVEATSGLYPEVPFKAGHDTGKSWGAKN